MKKLCCPIHGSKGGEEKTINFPNTKKYENVGKIDCWKCNKCSKIYVASKYLDYGIIGSTKNGYAVENLYNAYELPKTFYVYNKKGAQIPCGCNNIKIINDCVLKDKTIVQIPTKYCMNCNKYYITRGTYNQCRKVIEKSGVELVFLDTNKKKEEQKVNNDIFKTVALDNEKIKPANKISQAYLTARIRYNPYQYLPWLYLFNENKKNLLICDEVGLGKTIEAGILIKEKIYENKNNKVLIICPAFLRKKWKNELEEKFNLESSIFSKKIFVNSQIVILPLSQLSQFNELCNERFDFILVDEAHYFKNSNSARYKHLKRILDKQNYDNLVFMTATPINNTEEDYYVIKNLLGNDFAKTSTTKKQAYIDLPKRNIHEVYVQLSPEEKDIYNTTDVLPAFSGTIYRHIGASSIYALTKYVMMSNNSSIEFKEELQSALEELIDEEYTLDEDISQFKNEILNMNLPLIDSKMNKLTKIIDGLSESKIVIFSHYIETVKYL